MSSELAPKRILLDSGPSHSLDKNKGSPKHIQTYCTYENIHTCRHTYKRAYVHTYIHACARTYMHVRIMLFACCSVLVHRCCFVLKSDDSCCPVLHRSDGSKRGCIVPPTICHARHNITHRRLEPSQLEAIHKDRC